MKTVIAMLLVAFAPAPLPKRERVVVNPWPVGVWQGPTWSNPAISYRVAFSADGAYSEKRSDETDPMRWYSGSWRYDPQDKSRIYVRAGRPNGGYKHFIIYEREGNGMTANYSAGPFAKTN